MGKNRSKWGDFGQKWPVGLYLACGYVASRLWICGISLWICGMCKNREIVDTPTFSRFRLYMWYVSGRIFFPEDEFYVFSLIQLSFVSVCIRVVCTYIAYITFIFFLIILPRRIYNAVFFWRQYVKRIFFQKILIGRSERSERFRSAHEYATPVTRDRTYRTFWTIGNPPHV
mgnify:CR=1 FL=1